MRLMNEIVDPTECLVTPHIEQAKQPEGGYVNPEMLKVEPFDGSGEGVDALNPWENVRSGLVDRTVDRMARVMLGIPVKKVFLNSLMSSRFLRTEDEAKAWRLMKSIGRELDDDSIVNAVKLSAFDGARVGNFTWFAPNEEVDPDEATIENVKTMVERSLRFFKPDGPRMPDGFTLVRERMVTVNIEPGDGMVSDTVWDLKTSESCPTQADTLRLLVYWRMGLHLDHPWSFQGAKYLGIYNPRLNEARRISVDGISKDAIDEVEKGFE